MPSFYFQIPEGGNTYTGLTEGELNTIPQVQAIRDIYNHLNPRFVRDGITSEFGKPVHMLRFLFDPPFGRDELKRIGKKDFTDSVMEFHRNSDPEERIGTVDPVLSNGYRQIFPDQYVDLVVEYDHERGDKTMKIWMKLEFPRNSPEEAQKSGKGV